MGSWALLGKMEGNYGALVKRLSVGRSKSGRCKRTTSDTLFLNVSNMNRDAVLFHVSEIVHGLVEAGTGVHIPDARAGGSLGPRWEDRRGVHHRLRGRGAQGLPETRDGAEVE